MSGVGGVWFGRVGYDGKTLLSIAGMLGDVLWGDMAPLVLFGYMCSVTACSLVCCSALNDEEGSAIIHLLGTDSLP